MDWSTEEPQPCKSFSFFTTNLLPWGRYGASQRLLTSPAAATGLAMALAEESALRQSLGGDVAGWIVIATLCSAVTAYAQHSEPEKDMMLSLHTLSSQQPSGE